MNDVKAQGQQEACVVGELSVGSPLGVDYYNNSNDNSLKMHSLLSPSLCLSWLSSLFRCL